nr:hypothetical protein CFP56_26802 [Quercus suber]
MLQLLLLGLDGFELGISSISLDSTALTCETMSLMGMLSSEGASSTEVGTFLPFPTSTKGASVPTVRA